MMMAIITTIHIWASLLYMARPWAASCTSRRHLLPGHPLRGGLGVASGHLPPVNHQKGCTLGQRLDRQRGIDPERGRDYRTIDNVQVIVAPDLTSMLHDPDGRVISHGTSAQRMGGQEPPERPDPQDAGAIFTPDSPAESLHRLLHPLKHGTALPNAPDDIELPIPQAHLAVRRITADPQIWQEASRQAALEKVR